MKSLIKFGCVLFIGLFSITNFGMGAFAQGEQNDADGPKFEFKAENNRINLDTLYVDGIEEVNLEIEYENKGSQPLILFSVRACCGTRVVSYPEEPVSPGETGVIEVHFRVAPRPHNINRTVTADSNDPAVRKVLRITGRVEVKE